MSYIQRGEEIPRGDIQTIFKHVSYDQVSRLGLKPDTGNGLPKIRNTNILLIEAFVRKSRPTETGMLVVDQVVPKGNIL